MLLTEQGLNIAAFDRRLARMLGDKKGEEGDKVLAQALIHGDGAVHLRHWLYCLVASPGSIVRVHLIEKRGNDPDQFIENIELAFGLDKPGEPAPVSDRLHRGAVDAEVSAMLEKVQNIARKYDQKTITEAALTLAIYEQASSSDSRLAGILEAYATEKGLQHFLKYVQTKLRPDRVIDLFAASTDGGTRKLDTSLYSPSGRKFLARLREDAASLGAKRIFTPHLLYSLLGQDRGHLAGALAMRGLDVKRDLHTSLARHLSWAGGRRNDALELDEHSLLGPVQRVLLRAVEISRYETEQPAGEPEISRAFLQACPEALQDVLPANAHVDITALRDYLDTTEPPEVEPEKPLQTFSITEIEGRINDRIRGQHDSVGSVMPWIKRLRFGLSREGRPAGVFLFLGPTGTGKTQLAKELARYVFGDENLLLYLEMGQFQTKESMSGFVGAPPGYVGYGDGKLTNGLRDMPECVVLFDEIEKAHVEVFDSLLRFADEGLISDPAGPIRDGRRCLIVMTTNAGQRWLQQEYFKIDTLDEEPERLAELLGAARRDAKLSELFLDAARSRLQEKGFRPEFIGRLDELVTFLPLDLPICREIVDYQLAMEVARLREAKGIELEIDEGARVFMARESMVRSVREGARCVPRVINQYVINLLIDKLLEEEEKGVATHRAVIRFDGNEIIVEKL
ncbi:MAG: AAA family ATPase [Candidatus Lernaella stagnicola]|nr:AAA family ATPase [Candidatus Lernaella stagnicola]